MEETGRGSNPRSAERAASSPRVSSAPATSRTSDTASCPTTSASRSDRRRRGPSPLTVAFSAGTRSGRDAFQAGTRPNRIAVASETSSAYARTVASTAKSKRTGNGSASVGIEDNSRPAPCAISTPMPPPMIASTTLSPRSWRRRRPRLAPIAARTAISRRRAAARASSMFATFAHAIIRTRLTAASNTPLAALT